VSASEPREDAREERVAACVRAAIAEVNRLRGPDAQVAGAPHTVLVGEGGALDSLGIVNLVVALENAVERDFGQAFGLVGEILGASDPERFRTVGLLTDFVTETIAARAS
jgi:acyl carrier protein